VIKDRQNALVVGDVQNDFCPGGRLPVQEGDKTIPIINSITKKFYKVIGVQDWHPENHVSFARNHPGKKPNEEIEVNGIKQVLWPAHCVIDTKGAEFHPDLNTSVFHIIVRKGMHPRIDSYSAFMENDKKTYTGLDGYLKGLHITQVFFCGLALDYCVFYSAMDAITFGFETYVIVDATRGINVPDSNVEQALSSMKERGITIIKSTEL
jgi:nicotinamidase/pyrazinamidase